jgi:enoyl reductase-like protein
MINNSIEMQILRLIDEISEDEDKIRFHKNESIERLSDEIKNKQRQLVEMYSESLQRKMNLLQILKG